MNEEKMSICSSSSRNSRPPSRSSSSNSTTAFGIQICLDTVNSLFNGHAPATLSMLEKYTVVDFLINDMLRSFGQVIFANNPSSGLFILLAFFSASEMWAPGLYGIWTCFIANLFSRIFLSRENKILVRNGLFGFNSFLIGIALPIFLQSNVNDWTPDFQLLFLLFLLPPVCVILQVALNKHMCSAFNTPSFTLPFNIITIMFLMEAERPASFFKVDRSMVHPSQIKLISSFPNTSVSDYSSTFVPAVFKGPSQVFLIDSTAGGILVLTGIFIYSRISFIMAVVGAIIGYATSALVGTYLGPLQAGLWAYNSVLTSIAIGGVFVRLNTFVAAGFAVLASWFTALLFGVIQTLLLPWGLPVLTLPFCVGTIIFMLPQDNWNGFEHVPLGEITFPELHLREDSKTDKRKFVIHHDSDNEDDVPLDLHEQELSESYIAKITDSPNVSQTFKC